MEERPFKRVRLEGFDDRNLSLQTRSHEFGNTEASGSAVVQQGDQFGIQNHYHFSQHSAHNTTGANEDKYDMLHKSLLFPRMDSRVHNVSKALPETCEWLFQHKHFKEWQTGQSICEHNGFLWIKGKPGCGKSTIMKTTLEWAQKKARKKSSDQKVVYYFFNARASSSLEKSTLGFYRSLVYQLLETYSSLRPLFTNKFVLKSPNDPSDKWTRNELQDFLSDMVHSEGRFSLYILVDALDEGENETDVRDMINFLVDLSERALAPSSSIKLRICLSSRHYPYISIKKGLSLVVEEQIQHDRDIEIYVRKKLISQTKLTSSNNSAKEDLVAKICSKSASIFLWVVLVVRMLDEFEDHPGLVTDMRTRLNEIPADLNDLFAEILRKSDHGIEACVVLLQWVLFAMRPLEPSELYLATEYSRFPEDLTWIPFPPPLVPSKNWLSKYITDCSRGLVELTSAQPPVVQFIHETVRDYLVQPNGLASLSPALSSNLCGKSHEVLKTGCVRYISTHRIPLDFQRYESEGHSDKITLKSVKETIHIEMPFVNYSVSHVFGHSEEAQKHGISQIEFLRHRMAGNGEWESREKTWWNVFERFRVRKYAPETTLLYFLVEQGLTCLVEQSLEISNSINNKCGKYGSALQVACVTGNEEIVRSLIASKADVNKYCGEHKHTLLTAIYTKNFHLIPILQKHGAYLEQTPLRLSFFEMIARGSVQGVTLLLELGADKKWLNSRQESPLELAMLSKRFEIADLLMQRGFDFGIRLSHQNGDSILSTAISHGLTPIVDLLIKAGWNFNVNSHIGRLDTTKKSYIDILLLMVENGADVNTDNGIVMRKAIEGGDIEAVRLLIDLGADVNAYDGVALEEAIDVGNIEIVCLLIENGADVNVRNGMAIRNAARGNYVEIIRLLLENGANIDTKENGDGENALYIASKFGNGDIAQLLINNGADVNVQITACGSPLMAAAYSRCEEVVQILIKNGADVNAQGGSYGTALQAACCRRTRATALVRLLIENGADVNIQVGDYGTALQAASHCGSTEIVRLLLENGADINTRSGKYGSALGAASHAGENEVVLLLIEKRANVRLRGGEKNANPIEMAYCGRRRAAQSRYRSLDYSTTIQVLRNAGAEEPPDTFFQSLSPDSEY